MVSGTINHTDLHQRTTYIYDAGGFLSQRHDEHG